MSILIDMVRMHVNRSILTLLVIVVIFLTSCNKDTKNEFDHLPSLLEEGEEPLDFLDVVEDEDSQNNNLQNVTDYFSSQFSDIKHWGFLRFAQENTSIRTLNDSVLLSTITLSRKEPIDKTYISYDTQMGELQASNQNNQVDTIIYTLINTFFDTIAQGTIDKDLKKFVLESEIAVISRQIARSVEFSDSITEVRVGAIEIVEREERTAPVRVIRGIENAQARAQFQFYCTFFDNNWYINAIEGDFNNLLVEYQVPGEFTPLGTTGVTQGF